MSQIIKKGDTVRLVNYTTPYIGSKMKSKIRIIPNLTVTKAGKVAFSIETKQGERRFKQADIGKPVEGNIRQSFLIVLTDDMSLDETIEQVKASITKALNSRIEFYQELIAQHQDELSKPIPITNTEDDE